MLILFFLYLLFIVYQLSPIQFSHSVVSDSLRTHGLQHSRPPFPSTTPRVYSNSLYMLTVLLRYNSYYKIFPLKYQYLVYS